MHKTNSEKFSHFYLFLVFIAAFSGILFGYDTGVISGALLFLNVQFHLTPSMYAFVASAVLIGTSAGAIFSGHLADHYGRRKMLLVISFIFIIGTLITSFTPDVTWLIIGRIIVGLAIGVASYIGPVYISEISPAKYRGALVSLCQVAIASGILIAYIVDYSFAHSGSWRWMFGMGVIPAICLLIGVIFLPYSPRWILARGDEEQALAILNRIHGVSDQAKKEFDLIQKHLVQQKGTWRLLFSKLVWPTLLVGAGIAFIQQISGVNIVLYYAPTIFKMAGFHSASTAILATMGVGAIFVIFTLIALPLIDTWGRRPLLLVGIFLSTVTLFILAWAFQAHGQANPNLKWLTLGAMIVYIMGFSIGLGPIAWLTISEIFPLKVRGLGSSLATFVNWISNLMVTFSFPLLIVHMGTSPAFYTYFGISIFCFIFVYALFPETKGCSLEKIEENLYAGKSCRHLGDH